MLMPNAQQLSGNRLTLRLPELCDLPDMITMRGDAEVVRHIGGRPFSTEEVWHRLLRYRGHWAIQAFGYWTIRDNSTGSFVGEIGFADWKRDGLAELAGLPECGWALAPSQQRMGYATEALGMALAWLDTVMGPLVSACMISPKNVRSTRLTEAHGYAYDRTVSHHGSSPGIFVRTARPKTVNP